jgi:hypothetical protein
VIGYPAWYLGGCPDVEKVLKEFFSGLLSGVEVIAWLPPDYAAKLSSGVAFLRIFRLGGSMNIDTRGYVDEARVQFAALSASRDDANELMEFTRQVLYSFRFGGYLHNPTAPAYIQVDGELVGPQLIPEQMRDERLVAATFAVNVDRPKGLPDYRQALDLDNLKGNSS